MDGCCPDRMDSLFLVAYLVLAILVIGQSALTALQTWEHCRYARSCQKALERFRHQGRALVVVPCKGLDVGLEENLRAVMRQDYGDYEVTFVVESDDDPACTAIRRVMAEYPEVNANCSWLAVPRSQARRSTTCWRPRATWTLGSSS